MTLPSRLALRIVLKLDFEKVYDKVNWKALVEVLNRKGFAGKWVEWTMKWCKVVGWR